VSAPYEIRQGDALPMLRDLPACSVDAVVTDPPYSSGGQFRGDRAGPQTNRKYIRGEDHELPEIEGDSRDQRAFTLWCSIWLAEAWRATRPGGAAVVATDWRQLGSVVDAILVAGWVYRGIVPWVKPSARPQLGRFRASTEFFVWGTRGPCPQTDECHPGYFECSAPRDREHPTEKPEAVMRGLVRIAPAGGLVLDPFAGSGTTLVAALAEGRRALGFEMSPEYAAIAERRCSEVVAQVPRGSQQDGLFGGAP